MSDGKLQEDYAKLAYEIRLYRKQLSVLQREIEKITLTSLDLSNAMRTIDEFEKGETLIPVGGGSYVKGEVSDMDVLVAVGGGYLVEMDKKVAKEKLKRRVEATKTAVTRLTQEFGTISGKLESVSAQLKNLERRMIIDRRVEEESREDYV